MPTRSLLLLFALLGMLGLAAQAEAAEYVPGEVVVGYENGTVTTRETRPGQSVPERASELRRHPKVAYAVPNYIARASQTVTR